MKGIIIFTTILITTSLEAFAAHTPHEVIVKYKTAPIFSKDLKLHKLFPEFKMMAFKIHEGSTVEATMDKLKQDPDVEFVEPNYILEATSFRFSVFDKTAMTANDTFGVSTLSPAQQDPILVAVVDTGVDYMHPILQNRIFINAKEISGNGKDDDGNGFIDDIQGWNFVTNTNDPMDDHGHGTHVSGTIAGVKSPTEIDMSGNFKIMPLKFLDGDGMGTTLDAISAISYGLQTGVKVFNNSWGGGGTSRALHDVVTQTYQKGALFVVAAGNESTDIDATPSYPASFEHPNLLSIAASTSLGSLAWFSNFGKKSVDVAAPGVSIYSSMPNGMYGYMSGTSMATPYVSRVAMLMMDQNRGISSFQVKEIIMDTATFVAELDPIIASGGIVDASKAILEAQSTVPDGVIPPYTPLTTSLSSEYDPQNSVDMGPSGCGIITTSGPSDWTGGNTLSLILVAFFFVLIQLPARIQVSWVNVR